MTAIDFTRSVNAGRGPPQPNVLGQCQKPASLPPILEQEINNHGGLMRDQILVDIATAATKGLTFMDATRSLTYVRCFAETE